MTATHMPDRPRHHLVAVDLGPPRRRSGLVVLDVHATTPFWRVTLADILTDAPPAVRDQVIDLVRHQLTAPTYVILLTNGVGDPTLQPWSTALPARVGSRRLQVAGYPGEPTRHTTVTRQDLYAAITEATYKHQLQLPTTVADALRGWEGRPITDPTQDPGRIEDNDVLVLPAAVAVWHARQGQGSIHAPTGTLADRGAGRALADARSQTLEGKLDAAYARVGIRRQSFSTRSARQSSQGSPP